MSIRYDPEVDALSIIFIESTVTVAELGDGITAEYDEHGNLAGIEILNAARRVGSSGPLAEVSLIGVGE